MKKSFVSSFISNVDTLPYLPLLYGSFFMRRGEIYDT